MTSWMVVSSRYNFDQTQELNFTKQGFKTRQRKKVMERMMPGDPLVYYVKREKLFVATARVTSTGFEERSTIWKAVKGEDDYPWRVHIEPDFIAPPDHWVPADVIAPAMEYVKKWPGAK